MYSSRNCTLNYLLLYLFDLVSPRRRPFHRLSLKHTACLYTHSPGVSSTQERARERFQAVFFTLPAFCISRGLRETKRSDITFLRYLALPVLLLRGARAHFATSFVQLRVLPKPSVFLLQRRRVRPGALLLCFLWPLAAQRNRLCLRVPWPARAHPLARG